MGRKALIAVLCWLTSNEITAKAVQTGFGLIDNVSAQSASRLYQNVPVGVYAGANPYAAYTLQIPQFITPKVVPIKDERIVAQSTNNFLRDSYGQRFVEAPQSYAYKAALPQQFVPLQNLPAHLRQPLVAAAPSVQYGQATHFFGSSPFTLGNIQAFTPNHVSSFAGQPSIYLPGGTQNNGQPTAKQESTNNNNVYLNKFVADEYNKLRKESQIDFVEVPKNSVSDDKGKQQQQIVQKLPLVHAPQQTSITSITNGKKRVVNFITKPPVPLLDLTLLEPLTFDNPLVPQVQHFLPRISQVTYKKLPNANEAKKQQKVYIKTKSKTKTTKKKQKKVQPATVTVIKKDVEITKTPVTVHELHEESPEVTYEVNSPNYKETISEKKVSYNKETQSTPINISYEKKTQMAPVHYSYGHTQKPVHYSYIQSSSEPAQIKQAYDDNNQTPKHLIYHFNPQEDNNEQEERSKSEAEELSDENSNESDTEKVLPQQQQTLKPQHELAEEALENSYIEPNDKEEIYYQSSKESPQPQFKEQAYHQSSKESPQPQFKEQAYHQSSKEDTEPEHREQTYYEHPKEISRQGSSEYNEEKPSQQVESIFPQYEEVKVIPTYKPYASLQANANQNQNSNKKQTSEPIEQNEHVRNYNKYPESYHSSSPATNEKSKRIIIKDESPQEIFKPNEELMAAMVKKQEESEELFEEAYKNAAYGFPAYESASENNEKDIYNPANYGAARFTNDFDVVKSPVRQYEAPGDIYPAYARSNYQDARDKTSEKYYAEYAIAKPERDIERYKQKEDYYKNYKEHMPQKYRPKQDVNKKAAKLVVAPSYSYDAAPQKKQKFSKYRVAPELQEYNYAKEAPHDSSAFATRPIHRYKSKSEIIAPQYQYGFEPLMITRILDSELAAMASNDSPETETAGARKKLYKENFYIKKSNTANVQKAAS